MQRLVRREIGALEPSTIADARGHSLLLTSSAPVISIGQAALLAAGALPALQELSLNGNPGRVEAVQEALELRRAPLAPSDTSRDLFF